MTLYELAEWQRQLVERLDSADETTMPHSGEVDALCATLSAKAEGVCKVLKNYDAEADALEAEEKRLAARKKTARDRSRWLKNYLLASMRTAGEARLTAGVFKIGIRDNSQPTVFVETAVETLPAEFVVTKTEPNRTALLEAFRSGAELPAGVQVTVGQHVRIS